MLTFATEFPVATERTVEELLRLGKRWLLGSRYTNLNVNLLDEPVDDTMRTCVVRGESLSVVALPGRGDGAVGGLRYARMNEHANREWVTYLVGHKTATDFWVSLRVACDSMVPSPEMPRAKKPLFLHMVDKELGFGYDGDLPLQSGVVVLGAGDIEFVAHVVEDRLKNRLPIVYVSRGFDNEVAVSAKALAKELSGMAHVMEEPSVRFSRRLGDETKGRNVYGGNVAVYWPGAGRTLYRADRVDAAEIERGVINEVWFALANRRPPHGCDWGYVGEAVARRTIDRLRAKGSTALDEYIAAFDGEIAAKVEQLNDAEAEIARLKAEVRRLQNTGVEGGLLKPGRERDLYADERSDIVLHCLAEMRRFVHEGSRRQHVLDDLLQANEIGGEGAALAADIRRIFKDGGKLAPKDRSALERLGFAISDDGKHHKAVFYDDPRYTFVFSKTPSDGRSGLNFVSEITNKLL